MGCMEKDREGDRRKKGRRQEEERDGDNSGCASEISRKNAND